MLLYNQPLQPDEPVKRGVIKQPTLTKEVSHETITVSTHLHGFIWDDTLFINIGQYIMGHTIETRPNLL